MFKKTLALVTLLSFLVFSWSCVVHKWKERPLISVTPEKRATAQVSAVRVHSGEKIEFRKDPAARIREDSVVGLRLLENFRLERSRIKTPGSFQSGGGGAYITTTDGAIYYATRILGQDSSGVIFRGNVQDSVPLSNIDSVWIKEANVLVTFVIYVVLPLGIVFALAAASMSDFNMSMGSWSGNWFGGF